MKRKVLAAQNVSRMCLVCGKENSAGLQARFFELDSGELAGVFRPRAEHQGYPGRLHGGVVSAMLDETIGRAINVSDSHTWGVTVELNVRFRRPIPLDREVRVLGHITRDSGRLFEGTGEIVLEDGSIAAEARGKYLKVPLDAVASVEFTEEEWFADDLPLPGEIEVADGAEVAGGA